MAINIKIKTQEDVEKFSEILAKNSIKYSIAYTYDTKDKMLFIDGAIITIIGEKQYED